MTRRRSSPLGLELVMSVVLALVVLPLLSHGAPVQDAHADLQKYSEGCYYNYNHYSEGDRILTNEPCLNCTCHNKMLMCYLRVCPFTKPIGHDCTVEKREDQCCPIITCPEVPVDVSHNGNQLTTSAPGTELSIPEKYGCSIDSKFFPEGAQVPSNPNKPCELCYCIRNRTSCLMQECTLHIDGCQPIYNKGSCCPVRYNCDHENELLELEDFSTTTTTVRPTPGYILSSTTSPVVSTDCVHNNEVYADGASITGKNACEHCYCMRGDIVCAVQECEMPTLESGAKTCRALPPAAGECCPSNYVCDDDTATTESTLIEEILTTLAPKVQSDLHESVSQEDVQLQEHIDDTEVPQKAVDHPESEQGSGDDRIPEHTVETTVAPIVGDIAEPSTEEDKKSQEEEESPLITTVSAIKETSYETTKSPIEPSTIHKTEGGLEDSHIIIGQDKEYDSTQAPIEDEIITEDKKDATTVASAIEEGLKEEEAEVPSKQGTVAPELDESTTTSAESSEEVAELEKDIATTAAPIELSKPQEPSIEKEVTSIVDEQEPAIEIGATTVESIEHEDKVSSTEAPSKADITPEVSEASIEEELPSATDASVPSKAPVVPGISVEEEEEESSSESAEPSEEASIGEDKIDHDIVEPSIVGTTVSPVYEMVTQGEDSDVSMPEIGDHKTEIDDHEKKPKDEAEISTDAPVADILKDDELPQITEEDVLAPSRPLATEGSLKPEVPEIIAHGVKTEGTTIAPDQEAASQPGLQSVETEETSSEAQDLEDIITTRPTIVKEESQPDESIEGSAEGIHKPIEEEEEIPAVIQEIVVPKDEQETTYQTTALPVKESGVEDVSEESQEEQTSSEEGEAQSTESSVAGAEKEIEGTTTGLPVGIPGSKKPIDQEEEEAVKGQPDQGVDDSTTVTPSDADVEEPSAEEEKIKVQPEQGVVDSSSPSIAVAEEEAVKKQPEEGVIDSTTSIPADFEGPSSEEDEVKGQPDQDQVDFTTIEPASVGSKLPSADDEELKKQPEQGIPEATTIAPSVAGVEEPSPGEEKIKEQPEQSIPDSTTVAPSAADSKLPSAEDEIKEQPDQGIADATTIAPSVVGAEEPSSEEEDISGRPEHDIFDSSTIVPSVSGSEEPSSEEEEIKSQPGGADFTTVTPSITESKQPSLEEEIKEQPEQGIADATTIAPSVAGAEEPSPEEEKIKEQPEQSIPDSTTIASSAADAEEPSSEEEKVKEQPEQGISDSTTIVSPVAGFEEPSSEEQGIKGTPEQGIADITTIVPSVAASEKPSSEEEIKEHPEQEITSAIAPCVANCKIPSTEEEEIKTLPEQGVSDFTTIAPSIAAAGKPTSEEEIKEQPEQGISDSSTIAPSAAESEEPSSEEEEIKEHPEQGISDYTTITPSIADSKVPSPGEEEIQGLPEQGISDFTTITPSVADAGEPSSEEEIKGQPEQGISDSSTIAPSVAESEEPSSEEEAIKAQPDEGVSDSTTVAPSIADSKEEEEVKGQPEQEIDSTTAFTAGSKVPSAEEDEVKGQPEQGISDSTTIASIVTGAEEPGSEEDIKGHQEQGISEPSTVSPIGEEQSSEEEEIKGQPDQEATTLVPSIVGSKIPSSEEEEVKGQPGQDIADATTIAPSVADSKVPSAEEEEVEGRPEHGIVDSTTIASSLADSEVPSAEEDEVKRKPEQGILDSTTIASVAIDSELPSEAVDDDQQTVQEDIDRTTLPPIASSDEESSEVVEAAEGSGEQPHEIIPSAIPGEGDCLVNDKTFANNASVPTSSECELSCSCVSSIVVCQRVECFEPPQPNNCILDESSTDRCCPQYICGVDSFAEDQRPVTPEDIEDEEIQFTTLPPAKKYPEISGEIEGQKPVAPAATTVPSIAELEETTGEEQKPIKQGDVEQPTSSKDESTKTEQPDLSDEISTPSSIDIELPVVKPDGPMSHIKDEEESSGEGSGEEDTSTEIPQPSDEKIKPIPSLPSKPAQEVTGDIEEATSSKKPSAAEESTTLKAADKAGEESATVTPFGQGVSGVDDSVTIDSQTESVKPAVAQEEKISTEASISVGAPKIDESIFATQDVPEGESSTIRPIESETGSEAPSLTSVLESLDSEQSEETPETPDQSSSDSGEESTESEEDTKLPEGHVTTVSPIASEQSTIKTIHTDLAAEIVTAEATTTIPEGDYQKPEMPEDLSHTKVDAELPLETDTKKPVEPVSIEESDLSGESEESTEKTSEGIPPPKAPVSTVLTLVEPSEKDQTPPAISDKKDEFPATEGSIPSKEGSTEEVPVREGEPLSSTLAPATSEEELLSGTVTPISGAAVEHDEIPSQTSAPTGEEQKISTVSPVSGEESDEITSQTSAPTIVEQPIVETVAPVSGVVSEVKKDEIPTQTSVPVVEDQAGTASPALGDESEEEKEEIAGQIPVEEQPLPATLAPSAGEKSEEEIASQTSIPIEVGKPASEEEKEDIASQTSAPAIIGESIPSTVAPVSGDESEEQLPGTVAPGLAGEEEQEKEGIASHTSAPVTEKESEEDKEDITSQTSAPSIAGQPLPGAVVPGSTEVSEEEREEIAGQTSAPVTEKESDEEEKITSQTSAPPTGDKSEENKEEIASQTSAPLPGAEGESEEEKEELAGQTSAPTIISEPLPTTVAPSSAEESEEDISSQTSAPTIADEPLPGTIAPVAAEVSEEEKEEIATQTSAPAIVEQPLSGAISPSSEEEIVSETARPTAEDKHPGSDAESSTQTPLEEQDKETDITTISTPVKVTEEDLAATEAPTGSIPVKAVETEEESLEATEAPAGSIPVKAVEKEDEGIEEVLSTTQASIPAVEESLGGTEIPALPEQPVSHDIIPVSISETEEEIEEGSTEISAPVGGDVSPSKADRGSEEELESEVSTEDSLPHIEGSGSDEKLPIDKTLLQTETPALAGETVRPLEKEQPSDDEDEKPISSTDAAVIPEVVVTDEVTSQPSKPDSDDQISVDETVKPSIDEIPAQTESSVDKKESETPAAPFETEKPIPVLVVEKESETPVSVDKTSSEEAVAQTESPIFVPSVSTEGEQVSVQTAKPEGIVDDIPSQTEQPISLGEPATVSDDQQVTKDTIDKSTEDTSAVESESEEDKEKELAITIAPVDLTPAGLPSSSGAPIAPAVPESTTTSSEESEEESQHTEAPKDDVKVQTVAEFVTERTDELTTVLPIQDAKKEQIPEKPVAVSSEEAATSSEEEEGELEVSVTTQKVPHVPGVEELDEKTAAPEIPSEVSEEVQISEEHPTESAMPSPTTQQPIKPVVDRFDTDLPKPIATDEESSEEEETPLTSTVHPLFPHIGLDQTTILPAAPNASDKIDSEVHVSESTARPAYASSTTLAPKTEQPITSPPTSHQAPTYGHVPPQYPSYTEDEYTDEDETEVFGPGTCRYGGKLFVSAQQIPRDDPCDFCFCFRSDIICLQQSCPPPISGCHEEPISGFCCPRYECPVSMATVLNITTSTTTTSTTLPPHFLHHAYRGAAEKNGCHISGKSYRVGDKIDSASGPCMHCTCGGDGQMKCDPKTCSPEPMLRQMIAVVASRRR